MTDLQEVFSEVSPKIPLTLVPSNEVQDSCNLCLHPHFYTDIIILIGRINTNIQIKKNMNANPDEN